MKKATMHPNEPQRLAALKSYDILDTPPEMIYDDIVRIATMICGTPIALISLVDSDRQWFKAKVGLDAESTSREISFCGHVIQGTRILEIPDATRDERFADNPLVVDSPSIRFYAGAPLITQDGQTLGTLCVIDSRPKNLTADQQSALAALARQVTAHIESRRWMKEVVEQQAHVAQTARMAALGEMAGGLAHEINTPLCTLILGIEMLEQGIQGQAKDEVGIMKRSAQKMSTIIRNFMEFTKEYHGSAMKEFEIGKLVDRVVGLCLEKMRNYQVDLQVDASVRSADAKIIGDFGALSEVLINLVNNSFDALKNIESGRWIRISCVRSENELQLVVTDSGPGVAPEHASKLMEPFFTTKPIGKGVGLGLSLAKGVMERHGGNLVYVADKKPTTFVLSFPK